MIKDSEMVHCRGCGKQLHQSAKFCPDCGATQRVPLDLEQFERNRLIAALLAFLVGTFGIHRFYLRQFRGIFYLLFCWTFIPTIVSFIECIYFLMMSDEEWNYYYG